jgi:hypothetical protein
VPIARWRTELDTVLAEAQALGMTFVGLPGIFPAIPSDVTAYRALAREMNRFGAAAADRGLRFYYHNHDWEFARAGGRVLYDVLLDDTDPDLVFFELDLYWIVTAGRDPLDYLSRYDQSPLAPVPRQGPHAVERRPGRHVRGPRRGDHRLRADLPRAREQALPPLPRRARHAARPRPHGARRLRVPAGPHGAPAAPAGEPVRGRRRRGRGRRAPHVRGRDHGLG